VVVVAGIAVAAVVGGFVFAGTAAAAENVHDGTLEDPDTGDPIQSVNASETTTIRYGYEVDNVANTGESVSLFLAFPNEVNSTTGLESPGSFQVDVTCKCGGDPEPVSVSSSPTVADGPDGDGVQEMITVGIQPSKRDEPIDLVVTMTGPATYPNVTTETTYDLTAYVDESISSGQDTDAVFEDVTVTADDTGSDDGSGPDSDDGASSDGSTADDAPADDGSASDDNTDGSTPTGEDSATGDSSGGTATDDATEGATTTDDGGSTADGQAGTGAAGGDAGSAATGTQSSGDGAGFGAALAVASIMAGALLATRLR